MIRPIFSLCVQGFSILAIKPSAAIWKNPQITGFVRDNREDKILVYADDVPLFLGIPQPHWRMLWLQYKALVDFQAQQ